MDTERAKDMVPVHKCWDDNEAEVIISYLRAQGIEAIANSEVPHSVLPITSDGLGQVTVYVEPRVADQARELLDNLPADIGLDSEEEEE